VTRRPETAAPFPTERHHAPPGHRALRRLLLAAVVATLLLGPSASEASTSTVAAADNYFWSFDAWSSTITVEAGDTVTWENRGGSRHNVIGADWASGLLAPGTTYSRVFTTPGQYDYRCTLHEAEGMIGRVVVRGSTPTSRVLLPYAPR
jgi:plastocyanin